MELNNFSTEDAVDGLLPDGADEKIEGRSSVWSVRPILVAALCVFAMVAVVMNFGRVDLGVMDAGGLQELTTKEWRPWKEGEGKEKKYYIKADNARSKNWRPNNYQACSVMNVPRWRCDPWKYDSFPCTMPSQKSWSISSAGWSKTRKQECDANPACSGIAGWDDKGERNMHTWTIKPLMSRVTEKKTWQTCLKKRIKCGDGYFEYKGAWPSWCHSTYEPTLLTHGHLLAAHTEMQVKAKCDADPGCTGYTHMTDQMHIYLVNNHALRTKRGHALAQNKWWKSCMKKEHMRTNWHEWCW